MNKIQKRFLLFLVGCIGTRVLIAYTAMTIPVKYLPIMGYFSLVPSFGFMHIYLTNTRKKGGEVFGENIWWNHLRPFHSIMYFLFAFYAIQKKRESWKFLGFDVLVGFIAFIHYHIGQNNFSKLIK